MKHSVHLRTLEKCRKHSPAPVFYICLVFSNAHRVLSQCNTRLRLLYLFNKSERINVTGNKRKQNKAAGEVPVLRTLLVLKRKRSGYCHRNHTITFSRNSFNVLDCSSSCFELSRIDKHSLSYRPEGKQKFLRVSGIEVRAER